MAKKTTLSQRERNKAANKRHILESAIELFHSHGFDEVTMEAIADVSGVSKRTLYSYYPAKEAIVSAYWLSNVEQKSNLLPDLLAQYPDITSQLTAVFLDAAIGFKSSPELANIHFRYQFQKIGSQKISDIPSDFSQFLAEIIDAGKARGDVRNDLETEDLAMQLMFNFTACCLLWFSEPDAFSLDQRLVQSIDCFINGAGSGA